ncbi:MAG: hypothetical protein ACR2MF_10560 [Chthoniobacterales bacterium]
MKNTKLMIAACALLLGGVTARAQDYVILDRTADDYDRVQIQPDGTVRVYDTISRETNVPVAVLQDQRTRYGLGYGGLLIGNALAVEIGRPFDEIVALRQAGRGWGDIARQYNVNLGQVVSRAHRADTVFHVEGNAKKAAKFVNGHDARDGKLDGTGPGHVKAAKVARAVKVKGNGHENGKGHGGKGHGGGKGHK